MFSPTGKATARILTGFPGLERRMREAAATITDTVTRDAPVRKEVEAAYKVQMEREKEARQRELRTGEEPESVARHERRDRHRAVGDARNDASGRWHQDSRLQA